MVQETELLPFFEWFATAGPRWLVAMLAVAAVAAVGAWVVAATRHGPLLGVHIVSATLWKGLLDLVHTSPRRTLALAWLAVKESIRRRVVAVFVLFLVILLFAGWFLDPGSTDPGRLYISTLMSITSYLVLIVALFLSSMSLPADIRNRTIYTIVTKPVRPTEIVLGRLLGFAAIGSVLLAFTCVVSYVFVRRGLDHVHTVDAADLRPQAGQARAAAGAGHSGRTSREQRHRHRLSVAADGAAQLDFEHGHTHPLQIEAADLQSLGGESRTLATTGGPQGMLLARVPIYGSLRFLDRRGQETSQGINVGDEWTYRSYIEGGSLAAAIWTFADLRAEDFPDGLPVELTLGVFRTHLGNIEKGVPASLSLRNPQTGRRVEAKIFPAKEFAIDVQFLPRTLQTPDGKTVDLFNDLVADGKLEIWLRCLAPAQYFGMAQADVYLRGPDASFAWNFVKGYWGIWLQMVLLVAFGVLFSTFLSAPVAMLATVGVLVAGLFAVPLMRDLATGKNVGGGPTESFIRLLTQDNVVTELEPGLRTTAAKMLDSANAWLMGAAAAVVPEIGAYSQANHVASGFDIPGNLLAQRTLGLLGYLLPTFVLAFMFFKTREVAR